MANKRQKQSRQPKTTHAFRAPSERTLTCSFHYFGDKVTVTYWPNGAVRYHEAVGDEITRTGILAAVIVDWDIVDDDGEALPITEETLARLGGCFQEALMRATNDHVLPYAKQT